MGIITKPNTEWNEINKCASNDLGYLLNELSNILCDESGNRLLVHTLEYECITQTWNSIL